MCCGKEHASAAIPVPSLESIGSAIMAAPKVIAGTLLGVSVAVALSFVLANLVWFGLGAGVLGAVAATVLVRSTIRNLRTPTWRPDGAQTQARLNGAQRPAVEAPRRAAVEAPKAAALPDAAAYRSLAELGGAILAVKDHAR